jgi:DNA-binding transcriptional ArsR family regulator
VKTRTKLDKALETLVCSKRCAPEEASTYREKLKEMAEGAIDEAQVSRVSRIFRGLSEETRLRIVRLLQVQEMCVCEIMAALDLTQPTASHHLMILENAGIVRHRKENKWVFYRISDDPFIEKLLGLRP